MRPYILGIDPGISGAVAIYRPDHRELITAEDLPTKLLPNNKNVICISSFALWMDRYAPLIDFAVVEKVHAFTGEGVTSAFRFGEALGILKGVVTSYMIPVHSISPAVWKTQLRLGPDKHHSRRMVKHLFPKQAKNFELAKDHNKAEAVLLAIYGSLYCTKKPKPH